MRLSIITDEVSRPPTFTAELVRRAVDLHLKDIRDGRYVPIGTGLVPRPDILVRLRDYDYGGFMTLEPHLSGDLAGIVSSIERVREWAAA